MSDSESTYTWNANDYSNIITIGASALASVLLVLFKSRCTTINFCCGLFSCNRDVKNEDDEDNKKKVDDSNNDDDETNNP